MATQIITLDDLEQFRVVMTEDLIQKMKNLLEESGKNGLISQKENKKKWIKSNQVQRLLGISPGTLQTLRINGTVPFSKIGGVIYYDEEDIHKLLEQNKRNIQ